MRLFFSLIALIAFSIAGSAQGVSDITFAQSGSTIVVSYKISIPPDRTASTALFVSTDGGKTFQGPLKSVTGDIGAISGSGSKKIVWRVFDEMSSLEGDIVFEVRASYEKIPVKKESFLLYTFSGSSPLGLSYGKVTDLGWYGRLKTNLVVLMPTLITTNASIQNYKGNNYYKYTDEVQQSRLALTGGVLYKAMYGLYVYGGAGYGIKNLVWTAEEFDYTNDKKIGDLKAKHKDFSYSGVEIEAGAVYKLNKFAISAGVNTIGFKFFELQAGVGIFF